MALIFRGRTLCAICGGTLLKGEDIFATSGSVVPPNDPLWTYLDAAMHRKCFREWPLHDSFITKFNEHHYRHSRGVRFIREDGTIEERERRPGDSV